jgi:hypothetical protein
MSRFLYPIIFLSMILGFWFKDAEGMPMGERLVGEILVGFPDVYLIFGVPLIGIVIVAVILVLLFLVGGRIYKWDLNIVYGRIFKKLEELMTDIESLRS